MTDIPGGVAVNAKAPTHLLVIMADEHRTYMSIVHENEHVPYGKRSVRIPLSEKQRAMLEPRKVGVSKGRDVFEVVHDCWLEREEVLP
jgi:hypothetical protein